MKRVVNVVYPQQFRVGHLKALEVVAADRRHDKLDDAGELGELPPPILDLDQRTDEFVFPTQLLKLCQYLRKIKTSSLN